MRYDEVSNQVLLRSRDNDDVIMETLNLFALFLNSGDYQPFDELLEVKEKLNSAMDQYETLLKSLHLNNEHNYKAKKKYEILINKVKDNLE